MLLKERMIRALMAVALGVWMAALVPVVAQTRVERDAQGQLVRSFHDIYDQDGVLSVQVSYAYDSAGVVEYRYLTAYNASRQVVTKEQYTADDVLVYSESNKYDRRGNRVRSDRRYYFDQQVERVVETRKYSYDKSGKVERCQYYMNGKLYYDSCFSQR
ncbi:MAG: hypothetical protein KBT04_00005 [Bacteroidales bacterium]|nr:hypothetical protein [Candidatus Colimorpha onthohippi]